jgi:hypothetical protein
MKMPPYKPPAHLALATRKWVAAVVASYELEPHHLRLLTLAAEAWDRCCQARVVLDRDGLTFNDRFGTPRARPEIGVERDSRLAFVRITRELDLDIEPPSVSRRPPALSSNRGTR